MANITMRREQKRNGWYWYAYRSVAGKLHKVYLGKADDLTLARIQQATAALTGAVPAEHRTPDLRMTFFGPPQIIRDGVPVNITITKAVALLAYLSAHERPQRRDHLLTMLWPESAGSQARKNLRNVLWTIRTQLGPDALVGDDTLLAPEHVWADVRAFEQRRREAMRLEAEGRSALKSYQKMIDLYQGSFLEGVSVGDTAEFDTWLAMTRERYHELRLRALRAVALAHRAEGRWSEVVKVARAAVMQDALQEPMYRALMEAHARMGDRATAIRQYDSLRATLDRELGVTPLPETDQLRAEILLGKIPHTPVVDPLAPVEAQPARGQQPFVGRAQDIAALDAVWTRARATPAQVALISGEAGVGKSRLWHMWSSRLEAGVTVLSTRCLPTTQSLPFAPLADLLRAPAGRARLARLARSSPPAWHDDILQLVPELRDELPPRAQTLTPPATEERRRMFDALVQSLGFSADQRVALFIDDLHWADQATIEWLGYLMHRGQGLPFMLVAALRQEEASPAPRIEAIRLGGMRSIVSAVLVRWFTAAFLSRPSNVLDHMRQVLTDTPAEGYIACCEAIRDMDQRAILSRIQAKTLVIAGELDAASPPADGRYLTNAIAGANYVELAAAHMTNIEVSEVFTDAVIRFLTQEIQ